jgi:hypothetical protein
VLAAALRAHGPSSHPAFRTLPEVSTCLLFLSAPLLAFLQGTAAGQDYRFADKEAAQLRSIAASAPPLYSTPIAMARVNKPLIDSWVAKRITAILGFEDEVVIGLVHAALAAEVGEWC